ncbi:MAG: hypothetical protein JOY80_11390 [Candidatus Dormibacteraeota bacterium]|nr:hypothetical protein [Candidatus Dormibacteraeota bacterium]
MSTGAAPFATPPTLAAAPTRTEADSIACEEDGGQDPLATNPPAGVPEVSNAALLGAAGILAAGGIAAVRRR